MFDSYIIGGRNTTQYVPYEKSVKIEKPTSAEDLKLLKQIEGEVLDRLVDVYKVSLGDNLFEGMIYHTRSQYESSEDFYLVVKVNNKEVKVDVEVKTFLYQNNQVEIISEAFDELIKKFAEKLLIQNFESMYNSVLQSEHKFSPP